MHLRRVAANYLIIGNIQLINHVVEIIGQRVVNHYPLEGETALTEWLGGTIEITGGKAYHRKPGQTAAPYLLEAKEED